MKISLQPTASTPNSLSGQLSIDGAPFCYFLTLPLGDGLPGSAIPPGLYSVTIGPSPKFLAIAERDAWFKIYANQMPHVLGIPNRSNIEIHPGNYPDQTEGCILVGNALGPDSLSYSRAAFAALQPKIVAACLDPLQGCDLEMLPLANDGQRMAAGNHQQESQQPGEVRDTP